MDRHFVSCLILIASAQNVFAAAPSPASNEMKMEEVTEKRNKVDGDLDKEITNPKLRADSGSKSKFSMSSVFGYTGGALASPFAADRPNLSGLPETQVESSVNGTLKTRYRPEKGHSFTLGVSLGVQTPFQGKVNSGERQLNVGDPVVGYNYTFAALGLQNSSDLSASAGTSNESLRLDQMGSMAIAYSVMKVFPSRLHMGINSTAYHNFFTNNPGDNKLTRINKGDNQVDKRTAWAVTASPVVEYHFSHRYSVRTLFAYFRWRHLYGERNKASMIRIPEYQSLGVGIALSRDVYLYPNVQFLPFDMRSDFTNVGISSSINVF